MVRLRESTWVATSDLLNFFVKIPMSIAGYMLSSVLRAVSFANSGAYAVSICLISYGSQEMVVL